MIEKSEALRLVKEYVASSSAKVGLEVALQESDCNNTDDLLTSLDDKADEWIESKDDDSTILPKIRPVLEALTDDEVSDEEIESMLRTI